MLNEVHRQGTVQSEEFAEAGTLIAASVPLALANKLEPLAVDATYFAKQTTEFFQNRVTSS